MSQKYNPKIHHRRSMRLNDFDYAQDGYYFVTICTKNKIKQFGKVADGEMILNEYGKIVVSEWKNTQNIRKNVQLDEFVVMPNHIHGIVIIDHNDGRGVSHTPSLKDYNTKDQGVYQYAPTIKFKSPSNNLGAIVRGFKSAATNQINQMESQIIFEWQKNYYERVIRNEDELNKIRKYVFENPTK